MSRDEVAATQRRRICLAMAQVTAEKGYARTTVADIIVAAGVSRETFYQLFSSKQHCFEVAFESSVSILFADIEKRIAPVVDQGALEKFDQGLGAYLDAIAANSAIARLCLVEVFAAGPEAVARRARVQERFVRGVVEMLDLRGSDGRFLARSLVAAIDSMVTTALALHDTEAIGALRKPWSRLIGELRKCGSGHRSAR